MTHRSEWRRRHYHTDQRHKDSWYRGTQGPRRPRSEVTWGSSASRVVVGYSSRDRRKGAFRDGPFQGRSVGRAPWHRLWTTAHRSGRRQIPDPHNSAHDRHRRASGLRQGDEDTLGYYVPWTLNQRLPTDSAPVAGQGLDTMDRRYIPHSHEIVWLPEVRPAPEIQPNLAGSTTHHGSRDSGSACRRFALDK